MRFESAAVPDGRSVARRAPAISPGSCDANPPASPAAKPCRNDRAVLPALLHVPCWHGALLDVYERVPGRPPGGRAALATRPWNDRAACTGELTTARVPGYSAGGVCAKGSLV